VVAMFFEGRGQQGGVGHLSRSPVAGVITLTRGARLT
jgi:hypothetical protein